MMILVSFTTEMLCVWCICPMTWQRHHLYTWLWSILSERHKPSPLKIFYCGISHWSRATV
jgi:hypothetical protein